MSTKRVVLILIASVAALAAGVGPRLAANSQDLAPAPAAETQGATIPYTGRLTDEEGAPVPEGAYAFTFALYEAESGGEPLWSEVQEGVGVENGALSTALGAAEPIPPEALAGKTALWLAVGVRGPGEGEFTALNPRQRLGTEEAAAPASTSNGQACPHDHWGEVWTGLAGDGLSVGRLLSEGAVLATADGVGVYGWSGANHGVKGWSTLADASGVYGESTATSGSGVLGQGATGVEGLGVGAEGTGVHGHTSSGGTGVSGGSEDGDGVAGTSTNGAGVRGVQGNGQYYASGPAGVVGVSISPVAPMYHVWTDEVGVAGIGTGSGVTGRSLSGEGVSGSSTDGPGVSGSSANGLGVEGHSTSTSEWTSAVYGRHDGAGDGVYGVTFGRHGVYGVTKSTASDSAGVYARNDGGGAAVHSDGDLYVTGAYRGDVGFGGAPYPRPAYESSFLEIDPGECFTVYHNLLGDEEDYVVDLQFRNADGIHVYRYGGSQDEIPTDYYQYVGAHYRGLTNTQITLCRGSDDASVESMRVRIWIVK